MIKKIIIFIVIVGVVALGAKKLLSEKEKVATLKTPLMQSYSIKSVEVKDAEVAQIRPFLAQVLSQKEIKVATKMGGMIEKIYVSESDRVKKGDILVTIDDKTLRTNIKTLKKNLEVQEKDIAYYEAIVQRNKKLLEADALSVEKYDATKMQLRNKIAQRDATQDNIAALESDYQYLKIKAPFDGVIASLILDEGDLAVTGKPILAMNSYGQKIEFSFANAKGGVTIGDKVFYNQKVIGEVYKIYPNAKNNLNVAEVVLTKKIPLVNNSFLSIAVEVKSQRGCSLPIETFVHAKDTTSVMVYKNNRFHKVNIDVILEDEQRAIISPCVKGKVAIGSESKLSILPSYNNIILVGSEDEK
jgi:RND family efflux transporter MFP subunit